MKKILISMATMISLLSAGGCVVEPVSPVVPVKQQPVFSANGFYMGGAVSLVSARKSSVDLDFFSDDFGQDRIGNLTLLGGYNFSKYLALESRATVSVAEKSFTKLTSFSLFLKPQYPLAKKFSIYGLIGAGYVKLDNYHGSNVDVSKGSFQWGLGASYNINNKWSAFVDYTSLANDVSGTILDSKEADVDSINVGVIYKF